jgi:TetR/AcrR family transcriptional repressor of mexJK operon
MDAVAREAGVSKQTVYSHFENKDELYRACIRDKIASHGFGADGPWQAEDTRETLHRLAKRIMALICDPEVLAMHRVVMSEAPNYPRIAALFFEAGPAATKRAIGAVLGHLVERGKLRIDDIEYAAWQFANMGFGSFRMRLEFGVIDEVPEDELDRHLWHVVDDFVRLYGTRRGE